MERWKDIKWQIFFEQKKQQLKTFAIGCKENTIKAVKWVGDHPQAAAIIAASGIEASRLARRGMDAIDKRRSDREYYDHSLQQRMRLKRRMTNREKIEAGDRHAAGESYYDIYRSMGLL